jgi:hypothetical protein
MEMLPYLELPLCLQGLQEGEINNPDKVVSGKFFPTTITAYHESYYERTMIYLSNGQPFLIELTVSEYEEKIRQYFELINKPAKQATIHKLN